MSNANVDLAKVTISILVDFDKKSRFSISILRSPQHYYSLCDFVYTCNACRLQLLVLIRAGMAAECQVERSQIRNKEIALTVLRSRCVALSLSLSHSRSGGGACHGPDRLQKGPHASRVG